ncbi:uncharacterized protein LOC135615838 isoform X8 [Musa acuminata AAA Group]|uniref:uncharacterized protein LOC135615838 isoform X8 n=1 Tax=Musa acuminata AAA Group TaxID=214697 RepID=UPI0031DBB042
MMLYFILPKCILTIQNCTLVVGVHGSRLKIAHTLYRTHVMQVIKQLQTRARPTSNGETDGDQANTLQDGVGKMEEETGGVQSEPQIVPRILKVKSMGPEELDDSKGEAISP